MDAARLLSHGQIIFLIIAFSMVYLAGLFVPLMENDAAQHATMAMRMANTGDFLHIYKGEHAYLDKPHMHFWLAAISMKFLGVSQFAYRMPALLCLLLGAISTKKLAVLLYENRNLGDVAALVFVSAQTIVLSAHDVRTDAVLTGFIIFSIWQFVRFIRLQSGLSAALAGLGLAFAFSAKGQMAVVIVGCCIFSYLLYSRAWRSFFNVKLLLAVAFFALGIAPVLYAYWLQFGAEGLRFILFNQSLNRLNATGFTETSPDYFFFFHTLLWAFLPFSLIFYVGVFDKTAWFFKNKFTKVPGAEFLTLGGFWLVMLLFSFSKFKLPHYLNGLIAVLSVFTAAYLFEIFRKIQMRKIKVLWIVQLVVLFAAVAGILLLSFAFTGVANWPMAFLVAAIFVLLMLFIFKKENIFRKYVLVSLTFAAAVNLYLNTQFYPVLTRYSGSLALAEYVKSHHLDRSKLRMMKDADQWNFDFYTGQNTPRVSEDQLRQGDILLLTDIPGDFPRRYRILHSAPQFAVTRLSAKFINPKTRAAQLSKYYLVEILD